MFQIGHLRMRIADPSIGTSLYRRSGSDSVLLSKLRTSDQRFARWNVGLNDSQNQRMCFRIPLLKGEGAAKRRVRGTEKKEY
jgi:hypothetical protein